jgi:hypothetical protein
MYKQECGGSYSFSAVPPLWKNKTLMTFILPFYLKLVKYCVSALCIYSKNGLKYQNRLKICVPPLRIFASQTHKMKGVVDG